MNAARTSWLCSAVFWTATALALGQAPPPDDLDTSWNGTGTVLMPVQGLDILGGAMIVQPDGRILLAGQCSGRAEGDSFTTTCVARLLPSGVRDLGFGPNQTGSVAFSTFPSFAPATGSHVISAHGLLRQSDGRIVVVGYSVAGGLRAMVGRLRADGTLDPTVSQPVTFEFEHNDANPQSMIWAVAQQSDGKLVVAGHTVRAGADASNIDIAVARLRTNLTLDPSFNGTGVRAVSLDLGGDNNEFPAAVAIQPDGKIVVAGSAATATSGRDILLLRFNADGTRDTSFGNNGAAWFDLGRQRDDVATALEIDAAGRLWLAGYRQYGGTDLDMFVARVRADGSALDSGFNGIGYRSVSFDLGTRKTDVANDLLLQSDGKIVLAGTVVTDTGSHFAAARLLPDGASDHSFGDWGILHGAFSTTRAQNGGNAVALGGSGIVLAGICYDGTEDGQFGVAQIRLDAIFANGFEH